MTVYIAGRQTGKTIYLIWMSAKTGAVIVAPTYQMVSYIDQMARKLGLKIPPPISVVEWAQMVARKQVHSEQRYLVDELQMVLSQMNVEAATLNEDSKEEVHMFGVKETCCTRCSHRDVCQYKEEYLAAQHAVDEVSVHLPTKDENSARMIRLRDISWIEPVELKCRHFQQNTGVAR